MIGCDRLGRSLWLSRRGESSGWSLNPVVESSEGLWWLCWVSHCWSHRRVVRLVDNPVEVSSRRVVGAGQCVNEDRRQLTLIEVRVGVASQATVDRRRRRGVASGARLSGRDGR